MKLEELIAVLERLAPPPLAEEWDNPGLLVEPYNQEITRALVALDCTPEVVNEAKELGAQIVLSHHPLFFKPVKRLSYHDPETAAACALIRHGIGLFAAHTNLDCAIGGVNDVLAEIMGLSGVTGLTSPALPDIGRVGLLKNEMPLREFALMAGGRLNASVRYCGGAEKPIRRVAVVGGSGGSFIGDAKAAGADVLLTGEIKHSAALDAQVLDIAVVEAGHYETENVVIKPWIDSLQKSLLAVQCKVDLFEAKSAVPPLVSP